MKSNRRKYIILLIMIIISTSIGQTVLPNKLKIDGDSIHINQSEAHDHTICGNILHAKTTKMISDYIMNHPDYTKKSKRILKPQSFVEGEKKSWWIDTTNDNDETVWIQMESTCMAVGEHCYIFVSDESIAAGKVTTDQIDELEDAFDNSTPNFPNMGIFEVDVDKFGDPPDFDNDPRIIIFLYDIDDDYLSTGVATLGYFWVKDQFNDGDPAIGTLRSNETEIFYIDTYPLLDEDLFGVDRAKNTLAHEFQHMIHSNHSWFDDGQGGLDYIQEMTFVDEGCSEIASYICGYGLRSNSWYAQNPNVDLLSWGTTASTIDDYSRAALWTLYMIEQFGEDILKDFLVERFSSWNSFTPTFNKYSPGEDFRSVYKNFLIANYLNDTAFDSRYGYTYSPITSPTPAFNHDTFLDATNTGTVANQGANYITFTGGSDLSIDFTNTAGTLRLTSVKTGNPTEIDNIDINNNSASYTPSGYGDPYTTATIVIFNVSTDGDGEDYTYTSSGPGGVISTELAYEEGTPDGTVLLLNPGDSVAVHFDGQAGFFIDSIRIAFRQNGIMPILINEFNGIVNGSTTTPFGNPLVSPKAYNVNLGAAPGWYTIDLSGQNVSAENNFIVGAVLGADVSNPGIGAVSETTSGGNHTWMYSSGNFGAGWFNSIGDGQGGTWKYMIRATISNGSLEIELDPNGIVTIPKDFSLGTNYPNPFNPSTTFDFTTPNDGLIKFTVYDLLGQVIYSEKRNLFAGKYSFTWDGKNQLDQQVVSGVYFLKMEAEGFTQTRKMLMMK